jgi:arsenate reductase-like glutaredoxin family protein
MNKIYYLSTCSTSKRIIKELNIGDNFEMQDIKFDKITVEQLEFMAKKAGSYEALFSRRSRQFKPLGLDKMELGEADYKKYILEAYSFLKRPVIIIEEDIFVGNSKKVIEAVAERLKK